MSSLNAPKLDDRLFQDIVDEAKKRIPRYSKEWTDHNVSDPGVTLIELFAWMTEIILYRLNRVPERHYVKFMELLGMQLQEPMPAMAPVTFWLSTPLDADADENASALVIPSGTEVASTQTETTSSIVFTTEEDFIIEPLDFDSLFTHSPANDTDEQVNYKTVDLRRMKLGFEEFTPFAKKPEEDDALYFGFNNDISHYAIGINLDVDENAGGGIDPTLPPYVWEVSPDDEKDSWLPCNVELDETLGLNASGQILIHLPKVHKQRINRRNLYWLRLRNRRISDEEQALGVRPYRSSPKINQLSVVAWGGTARATHSQVVHDELLGVSDGSAGQSFQVQVTPMLARRPEERIIIETDDDSPDVYWTEVDDFSESKETDFHYTLESVDGEVSFAPAIRQPNGEVRLFGAIPPRSSRIIFKRYRYGGGADGNLQAGILNTLKTSIPFVARVSNRVEASGGLDAETLEAAMRRAPAMLRSRDRAVTEADFEFLSRQALRNKIARVKCLQPQPSEAGRVAPGQIYVLVIPHVPHPSEFIPPERLNLPAADVRALRNYLNERRLLTTRLDVREPAYKWVSIRVRLQANIAADSEDIEVAVIRRLNRFLNPLTGGHDGEGWGFGRELYLADVYQALQGIPNVVYIREVQMFETSPGGSPQGRPKDAIEVLGYGTIASGLHEVELITV